MQNLGGDPIRKSFPKLTWLAGYIPNKVPPPGVEPRHVTHPSTNRARRRVTSLIRPTPLPLRHTASCYHVVVHVDYLIVLHVHSAFYLAHSALRNFIFYQQPYSKTKAFKMLVIKVS